MARNTAMTRKKRRSSAAGYVLLGVLILMIGIVLQFQSRDVRGKIAAYAAQEAGLDAEIASEQERSEEIAEFEKYVQTKAYAEEQAHEKLELVNEGEIIFKLE